MWKKYSRWYHQINVRGDNSYTYLQVPMYNAITMAVVYAFQDLMYAVTKMNHTGNNHQLG